jgi:hypothetical protein
MYWRSTTAVVLYGSTLGWANSRNNECFARTKGSLLQKSCGGSMAQAWVLLAAALTCQRLVLPDLVHFLGTVAAPQRAA